MGILPGSGPLGSGPTGPGSGFSVMPRYVHSNFVNEGESRMEACLTPQFISVYTG